MQREKLPSIRPYQVFFGKYARGFLSRASEQGKKALGLKIRHTQRVFSLCKRLSQMIGLDSKGQFLACLCGLFHDIGRFEQYERYRTFYDLDSEDHAALSVNVLKGEAVLSDLSSEDQNIVLEAIYAHNKFSIPDHLKGLGLKIAKLIRDADKIDIWRVFNEFYKKGIGAKEINLGLKRGNEISDKVFQDFMAEKVVNIKDVRNQLDFMVMRLSWIYDINFKDSITLIKQTGYLKESLTYLTQDEKSDIIRDKIERYLNSSLNGD